LKVVIGEILPLALVVTVSPVNIIAAIVLLFSKRPVTNATCYLLGFVVGVAAVVTALVVVADLFGWHGGSATDDGVGMVKLLAGLGLGWAAVWQFRKRPRSDDEASMPHWMEGIENFSPGRSLVVGAGIGAGNPKNIVVCVAAGLTIASAALPVAQEIGAVALYVVVAVIGVAAPLVVTLALGERADTILERWRDWLTRYNTVVMATIFFVFAVVLVGQAISTL
jgi:threonine/homoserine/homoserine lactone efflux protein